jgi:hypothetical protein
MAIPAARDPGPLVTLVRNRTVAKVDSIGDLGDRFGVLDAVVDLKGFDRELGLVDVFGVIAVLEGRQSTGMC